jgi:hypothetical protein
MIKSATLILVASILLAACNAGPPPQNATNTVGGANVVSSAKVPMAKATSSLTLDWGPKAQAGQIAIADVITYGGPTITITAPEGWQQIRDDSTKKTRQSLYWHAIAASDRSAATWTFSPRVDAQGAIVVVDNAAASPVDMSNGKTGGGGDLPSDSLTTTADGNLVLIFKATDFGNAPLVAPIPNDMTAVVAQEKLPNQFWILATWQNQNGPTEETKFSFPQLFDWVSSQVAIKHAPH